MTGAVSPEGGKKLDRVAKNWTVGVWERGGPAAARTIGGMGKGGSWHGVCYLSDGLKKAL